MGKSYGFVPWEFGQMPMGLNPMGIPCKFFPGYKLLENIQQTGKTDEIQRMHICTDIQSQKCSGDSKTDERTRHASARTKGAAEFCLA